MGKQDVSPSAAGARGAALARTPFPSWCVVVGMPKPESHGLVVLGVCVCVLAIIDERSLPNVRRGGKNGKKLGPDYVCLGAPGGEDWAHGWVCARVS
jgi:hypothetical protein